MSLPMNNLISNYMTKTLASAFIIMSSMAAAQAATVNSSFAVSVSLNAICTASNSAATTLGFGSYTAFQTAANTASVALTFSCTRGLTAPTFSFDSANGSTDGHGLLAGLNYALAATNAATTSGTAATAVANGTGTADVRTVTVTGTMAGGQAGDCTQSTATSTASACAATASHNRTLTVTY